MPENESNTNKYVDIADELSDNIVGNTTLYDLLSDEMKESLEKHLQNSNIDKKKLKVKLLK